MPPSVLIVSSRTGEPLAVAGTIVRTISSPSRFWATSSGRADALLQRRAAEADRVRAVARDTLQLAVGADPQDAELVAVSDVEGAVEADRHAGDRAEVVVERALAVAEVLVLRGVQAAAGVGVDDAVGADPADAVLGVDDVDRAVRGDGERRVVGERSFASLAGPPSPSSLGSKAPLQGTPATVLTVPSRSTRRTISAEVAWPVEFESTHRDVGLAVRSGGDVVRCRRRGSSGGWGRPSRPGTPRRPRAVGRSSASAATIVVVLAAVRRDPAQAAVVAEEARGVQDEDRAVGRDGDVGQVVEV